MIDMKEIERYAESKGLKMWFRYNRKTLEYKIAFEKQGYVIDLILPDNRMFLDEESTLHMVRRLVDEASERLDYYISTHSQERF